jgi:hypothetical protein
MKRIELSKRGTKYKGKYFAHIDDSDYSLISQFNWSVSIQGAIAYATTTINGKTVSMHKMLMGGIPNMQIDHKDGNGLNNIKDNLRFASKAENQYNSYNSTKTKGVSYSKTKRLWRAYINKNRKQIFIGYYKNQKDALMAYNKKAQELFGDFARLNEIKCMT